MDSFVDAGVEGALLAFRIRNISVSTRAAVHRLFYRRWVLVVMMMTMIIGSLVMTWRWTVVVTAAAAAAVANSALLRTTDITLDSCKYS